MSDISLYLIYDDADEDTALALKDRLTGLFVELIEEADDRPDIELRSGLKNTPSYEELGPLALVLPINPGRNLREEEQAVMQRLLDAIPENDIRILPLALDPHRNVPPAPLSGIVAFKVHLWADGHRRLAHRLLNLLFLRTSNSDRKIFVSYRATDGAKWANRLANELQSRGYKIWQDQLDTVDGQMSLDTGSQAQTNIKQAILGHGFVLLVDSPEATQSRWVHEEVNMAISFRLPILPVVIKAQGDKVRPIGGRFRQLQELQDEITVPFKAQEAARGIGDVTDALDDAWFDDLEVKITEQLLANARNRRALLRAVKQRFEKMGFRWTAVSESHLLYLVEGDLDGSFSPHLWLRLLVQCDPYETVLNDNIRVLSDYFETYRDSPNQYCVLIHDTVLGPDDKRSILRAFKGHILLLKPDEIGPFTASLPFRVGASL